MTALTSLAQRPTQMPILRGEARKRLAEMADAAYTAAARQIAEAPDDHVAVAAACAGAASAMRDVMLATRSGD